MKDIPEQLEDDGPGGFWLFNHLTEAELKRLTDLDATQKTLAEVKQRIKTGTFNPNDYLPKDETLLFENFVQKWIHDQHQRSLNVELQNRSTPKIQPPSYLNEGVIKRIIDEIRPERRRDIFFNMSTKRKISPNSFLDINDSAIKIKVDLILKKH